MDTLKTILTIQNEYTYKHESDLEMEISNELLMENVTLGGKCRRSLYWFKNLRCLECSKKKRKKKEKRGRLKTRKDQASLEMKNNLFNRNIFNTSSV